jgi:hypothetical protein
VGAGVDHLNHRAAAVHPPLKPCNHGIHRAESFFLISPDCDSSTQHGHQSITTEKIAACHPGKAASGKTDTNMSPRLQRPPSVAGQQKAMFNTTSRKL